MFLFVLICLVEWVILLNLVHTGYLQFLVMFHNLTANEHGFFGQN